MARPFVFPDPNDRSPNDPSVIVSPTQVLGIYKQYTGDRMERVTAKVQEWFCEKAETYNIWLGCSTLFWKPVFLRGQA